MAFKLTTLDDVKTILGDSGIGSSYDTELNFRIESVSKRAGSYCGRDFEQATHTEIHEGGESRLYVDNPPVVSITSIVWDDLGDFANGYTLPTSDYFLVNKNWDIAYSIGPFPGGQHGLQITYVGGYLDASNASTTIPLDLKYAIAQQVVWEFRRRKDYGLIDVSMPDGSIRKQPEDIFIPAVKLVLKAYRSPRIG